MVTREKEGHYIMKRGSLHQEHTTTVNVYVLNTGASKYIKQILTYAKGEIDINTIILA